MIGDNLWGDWLPAFRDELAAIRLTPEEQAILDQADVIRKKQKSRVDLLYGRLMSGEFYSPGHCERPEGCVCGGDTPEVQQGCAFWVK